MIDTVRKLSSSFSPNQLSNARFWFLKVKNEASFLKKITFQKRVFVFDDIFHPVWWEKVKSKTKTRFCFSFLSDRLDHFCRTWV